MIDVYQTPEFIRADKKAGLYAGRFGAMTGAANIARTRLIALAGNGGASRGELERVIQELEAGMEFARTYDPEAK